MKIQRGKLYAVITGDIVGSSRLSENDRIQLHHVMRRSSAELRSNFSQTIPFDVDIFRGDSWQLLLTDPVQSLRIGLLYRTFIRVRMKSRKIDTRLAIAIGTVDFLPGHNVSSGDGEAFRLSGSALESMPKSRRMTFEYSQKDSHKIVDALDVVMQLIDAIAIDWTEKQAQAVAGSLRGMTQETTANAWRERPVTQQAVAQHLDRASWSAVEKGLLFFEKSVSALVHRNRPEEEG